MQLVGAFDHRHVFLDPRPDPEASYAERKRLFELPRSSWDDYDRSLISEGGGVWPRSAKSVALSPEARALLCVEAETLTPSEVISALLKAPVDLLFNGGVGTYVKASTESHADVGDRANDQLRVDGVDLRCRAVVEGGNLGCTQRGRIEYGTRRRSDQHGRDRQLGRSRLLRPRGEHQGPARRSRRGGGPHPEAAQRHPRRHGGRGRPSGAPQQLRAEPRDRQRPCPGGVHGRRARALHPVTRARGPHRPHPRVPADRSSAVRASIRPVSVSPLRSSRCCSRTRRPRTSARCSRRTCPTILSSPTRSPPTSRVCSASASAARWTVIDCGARSSPCGS